MSTFSSNYSAPYIALRNLTKIAYLKYFHYNSKVHIAKYYTSLICIAQGLTIHKNTEYFIKFVTTCLFFKDFITIWLVQHNVFMLYHLSLLHPMELFIIFVFSTYNFSISNEKTNCIHIQFETSQVILCKISEDSKI